MFLAELWRYPIKSLRGEELRETTVGALGIPFSGVRSPTPVR